MFSEDTIGANYLTLNDTIVPDSLSNAEQINQTASQDSVWNALLNSLFHDPSLGKGEVSHFLLQQPAAPFENLSYSSTEFDWFFVLSLVFLLFLAIIRLRSFKVFTTSYDMLLKGKSGRGYNSDNQVNLKTPVLFVLCMWIGLSFIVYCLAFYISSDYSQTPITNNYILKWSFIATAAFILLQSFLLKTVSVLFDMRNIEIEYRRLRFKLYFILTVLAFPFVFLFVYYQSISSLGQIHSIAILLLLACILLICTILLFHQLVQGWQIFGKKFQLYEYFLYLCTIEILPLLIFFKLAISSL